MSSPQLSLRLARLMVAAAWVDGDLHPKERSFLLKSLESLPGITGPNLVEVYELLEAPMAEEDRDRAVAEVVEVVKTPDDKALVMNLLTGIVEADDLVRRRERALLKEVRTALDGRSTGVIGRVSRLVRTLLNRIPPADLSKG